MLKSGRFPRSPFYHIFFAVSNYTLYVTVTQLGKDDASSYFGTLRQCRSQKFQKCIRKQFEIGQKAVSYIKLSEICPKCVRKVSKMCQIQNYVKNVSDQNQKCLRNVSKVKNVSEKHQF